MTDIDVLPFDQDLGYPQQQQAPILGTVYTIYYRWNPDDNGFCVLKIVRNQDSAIVLNSRIEPLTPLAARDPITHVVLFVVYPNSISDTACEVWLVYD